MTPCRPQARADAADKREGDRKMKKKFKCEIDCANCAAKVEEAISKIDGVKDVKVNFIMQKFTLEADDEVFGEVLKKAIAAGRKIEPDFSVEL